MCRLLAYAAREPIAFREVLGDGLERFVQLSHLHGDGWGIVGYGEEGDLTCAKAPEAAYSSAEFAELVERLRTDALVAHLRWATPGLRLSQENTHPFVADGCAFVHHGRVGPLDKLDGLISQVRRSALCGTTDSERLLLALMSAYDGSSTLEDAYRVLLLAVEGELKYTSLNSILLTRREIYALCCYDPHNRIVREEMHKDVAYYDLRYRIDRGAVLIASEEWEVDGWERVPNGHALVVERGTLETRLVKVTGC